MKTLLQSILGTQRSRRLHQNLNALKRVVRPKHEPEVLALPALVGNGDIVCEIGANYAQYSRVLSKLVGASGQVFAFEPAEITYQCLVRNCRLLGLKNVHPKKLALSSEPGTMEFHTPIKRKGVFGIAQASLAPDPTTESLQETVVVDTLDDFLSSRNINKISFIRCDVEGAEMSVFLGAINTLKNHRPTVLVEVHPEMMNRFGHSAQELTLFFQGLGYEFAIWKNGALESIETLVTDTQECRDFFCRPSA